MSDDPKPPATLETIAAGLDEYEAGVAPHFRQAGRGFAGDRWKSARWCATCALTCSERRRGFAKICRPSGGRPITSICRLTRSWRSTASSASSTSRLPTDRLIAAYPQRGGGAHGREALMTTVTLGIANDGARYRLLARTSPHAA